MKYLGAKSVDSEIKIDLEKGRLIFDYSLNKYQSDVVNSNYSIFDFGRRTETGFESTLSYTLKSIYMENKMKILFFIYDHFPKIRPKIQYYFQDFQIDYNRCFFGVNEYMKEGYLKSTEFIYHIGSNLWFEYELEGDYKEKIKSIELKRRFVKNIDKFGTYDKQDGWDLVLQFNNIPMYGKIIIRYL